MLALFLTTSIYFKSVAQTEDITYHWATIDGIKVFYRTAGIPQKPAIILLHGFPSSSIMFQDLINLLKKDFYLVAPDYPGHGYSGLPPDSYKFTFDNISKTVYKLLQSLKIQKYSLFMQDYGSPVGFRLAMMHPESIRALVIQNANAYIDGFPEAKDAEGELRQYWRTKDAKYEKKWIDYYRMAITLPAEQRNSDPNVSPDRRTMDAAIMLRPGRLELFMQLWYDYGNNVKDYPLWHQYLRLNKPHVLVTWGKDDTSFTVPGAIAYLQDVPKAEIHLLNGGHWAVAEHNTGEIAEIMISFFKRNNIK